jgi:hypothetical protein
MKKSFKLEITKTFAGPANYVFYDVKNFDSKAEAVETFRRLINTEKIKTIEFLLNI